MTVGKKTSDQLDGEIEIDASNALISEIPPLIYMFRTNSISMFFHHPEQVHVREKNKLTHNVPSSVKLLS